jgi:hypothetical protein
VLPLFPKHLTVAIVDPITELTQSVNPSIYKNSCTVDKRIRKRIKQKAQQGTATNRYQAAAI